MIAPMPRGMTWQDPPRPDAHRRLQHAMPTWGRENRTGRRRLRALSLTVEHVTSEAFRDCLPAAEQALRRSLGNAPLPPLVVYMEYICSCGFATEQLVFS